MVNKSENFERAFSTRTSGCRRKCNCGKQYYSTEDGYDWDEGQLEGLEADQNAIGLQHSVSTIAFEGKEYVDVCECWKEIAVMVMEFIDSHANKIADYLNSEKKRKQLLVDLMPTVDANE